MHGTPVCCDPLYGRFGGQLTEPMLRGGPPRRADAAVLSRIALHARRLTLDHPRTGERLTFAAPVPPDLQHLVERLRVLRAV